MTGNTGLGWGYAAHPWHGDSRVLSGCDCSFQAHSGFTIPPDLDKMLREWGNGSGHRERCQCSRKELLAAGTPSKEYLCPLPSLECPSGHGSSILAQWGVLLIICKGLTAAPAWGIRDFHGIITAGRDWDQPGEGTGVRHSPGQGHVWC